MKNKEKTILCLLISTFFLLPLLGDTVVSRGQDTYYFNSYDENIAWETNPSYMVDGNERTYASTTYSGDVELCNDNSYDGGGSGFITKVEIRVKGYAGSTGHKIILIPVFCGTTDGFNLTFDLGTKPSWSRWFEISPPSHIPWTWDDVECLDCKVVAVHGPSGISTIYCSIVQIRVTYI